MTVSAAQDDDGANDAATISHAVSGADYASVAAGDVAVTVSDDDTRGVGLSATALTMPEGGSQAYTAVLLSQPTGPVTVTPSVSGSPDVTVSPSALTFTAENWNMARTVTVSAAQDADAANDAATISHAVAGGDYGSVSAGAVAVTVEDEATASTKVALTVSPGTVQEEAGSTLIAVSGTLDAAPRTSDTAVTVVVGAPGDRAEKGVDYEAVADLTLTIRAGQTTGTATFSLKPIDDSVDERDETVTVGGSARNLEVDAAVLKIVNNDPLPQGWIARFGRTVVEQVLEAVENRMTGPRAPRSELRLAGRRVETAATPSEEPASGTDGWRAAAPYPGDDPAGVHSSRSGIGPRTASGSRLLSGSSFAVTRGSEAEGIVSLWGRGAISRFDGREDRVSLDGEVASVLLGADWTRDRATSGLILSRSRGEGGYRGVSDSGTVSSTLTGLFPWGRYDLNERLSIWGVAGYGGGEFAMTPARQATIRSDLRLFTGAVGMRGVLADPSETGGLELAVKTDGYHMRAETGRTSEMKAIGADVNRLRLGLEGSYPFRFADRSVLATRAEIGARKDGGDAETGMGVDVGGGLSWTHPASGVSAEVNGRGLLTHESRGFRIVGIAGSLSWNPKPATNQGPSFTIGQTAGASATGGMNALFGRGIPAEPAANESGDGLRDRRVEVRASYGVSAFGGRFDSIPELGFALGRGHREYSLGWRLYGSGSSTGSLELRLEATRRERDNENAHPENAILLRFGARF